MDSSAVFPTEVSVVSLGYLCTRCLRLGNKNKKKKLVLCRVAFQKPDLAGITLVTTDT